MAIDLQTVSGNINLPSGEVEGTLDAALATPVNVRTLSIGAMIWTIARHENMSSAFVLPLVSGWLDALQQVRSEQEKNDYAKKCLESLRVLQQLVFEIIENEPVNDDGSAPNR
jgi:hypothetical protein